MKWWKAYLTKNPKLGVITKQNKNVVSIPQKHKKRRSLFSEKKKKFVPNSMVYVFGWLISSLSLCKKKKKKKKVRCQQLQFEWNWIAIAWKVGILASG